MAEPTFLASLTLIPVLAYALGHIPLTSRWQAPQPPLPILLAIAFLARWLFLVSFPNSHGDLSFDYVSFRITGDTLRHGLDVYAATDRHPYLPFHMYVFAAAAQLDTWFDPKFFSWVRWPNIIADLGIVVLLYQGSLKLGRTPATAFWLAFLWAVHPISILTSVVHGQFDSVAACFALLSWYLLRFRSGLQGALLGGLALGFGVLDKSWPVLLAPALVILVPNLKGKALFAAGVLAVPALFVLLYYATIGTSFDLLRERVLEYQGAVNHYGYPYAFRHYLDGFGSPGWADFGEAHGREILLATLAIVGAIVIPRRDELTGSVTLIAAFLAATHGFGTQYLVWIIPFALMSQRTGMLGIYSGVAVWSLLIYYFGTCGYQCPGRLTYYRDYWELQLIWPVAILWLLYEVAGALSLRTRFESLLSPLRRPASVAVEPTA